MERRILTLGPLLVAAFFVCLGGCGGGAGAGDGDRAGDAALAPPPVTSNAASGFSMVAGEAAPSSIQAALPTVCDGFGVEVYAHVSEPMKLSFGADGALYVGRQGGNRIHRVAAGGGNGVEFGPPMVDPDAVLVDVSGRISGVANSVLVGGGGILAAIFPDQTAKVVFNSGFADVDDMKFDRTRRLVFSDDLPQVLVSRGSPPTVLFSLPTRPGSIAIDDDDRIFVVLADGTIRIYNADGSLADSAFATGLAGLNTYIAIGTGPGGTGKALFVLSGSELLRFNRRGHALRIGSGFSVGPASGTGFVFGPDHALYVSEYDKNRIVRIGRGHGRGKPCPKP